MSPFSLCVRSLHRLTFFGQLCSDYECLASEAMHVTKNIPSEQNVLIIQPYVKWGPKKSLTTPDLKLQEAEDLIRSLDTWSIRESLKIGLETFDKTSLFGRGKLEELKQLSKKYNNDPDKKVYPSQITCSISQFIRFHLVRVDFMHFREQKCVDEDAKGESGKGVPAAGDGSFLGGHSNTAFTCDEP